MASAHALQRVWINRSALPLVLGVVGVVRMCSSPRVRQASADHCWLLLAGWHLDRPIQAHREVRYSDAPRGATAWRKRASDLMSSWIRSSGITHSYFGTRGLGPRFFRRPRPSRLKARATVEKGPLSSRAMWRRWSR